MISELIACFLAASLLSKLYLLAVQLSNMAEQRMFTKFYRCIKYIRDSIIKRGLPQPIAACLKSPNFDTC
jgi:hypothetical protein